MLLVAGGINNKGDILTGAAKGQGYSIVLLVPHSQTLPAESMRVGAGRVVRGGLGSLAAEDGDELGLARFVVPNASAPPVSLVLEARLPERPFYLWLTVRARADAAGPVRVRAELFDRALGEYRERDGWEAPVGAGKATVEAVGQGRLARFLDADNRVRARVRVLPGGPAGAWTLSLDQASFHWVPVPAR